MRLELDIFGSAFGKTWAETRWSEEQRLKKGNFLFKDSCSLGTRNIEGTCNHSHTHTQVRCISLHALFWGARPLPRTLTEQTCEMPIWVDASHAMLPEYYTCFPAFHSHVLDQREGLSRVCSHIYCKEFDGHGPWSIIHYISPLRPWDILLRPNYFLRLIPTLKHYSEIVSGILTYHWYHLEVYTYIYIYMSLILTFYLTFFLVYIYILFDILCDILSGIYSDILSGSFWDVFWHTFWHVFWHSSGIPSGIYFDILSGIFSGIHSGILSGICFDILSELLSGVLSDIVSGVWLRSGSAHWGLWSLRLRSGSAH